MRDMKTINAMLIVLVATASAAAQTTTGQPTTRASILEAARSAQASQSTPPGRSRLDRWLSWYDNQYVLTKLMAGWKGIHVTGGDFPAGAGIKFGVGFDRSLTSADDPAQPNRLDVTAGAAYGTRGYSRLRAGLAARNLGGSGLSLEGFGQYYEFSQEDFFGFGPDSDESARTNYLLDAIEAGAAVRWRPRLFDFAVAASYFGPRTGRGTDSRFPSTEEHYTAAEVPGLGTETDFLKTELSAAFDWRDNPSLPRTGGRYEATVGVFDDRDIGSFDFRRVGVALQQYVALPDRYRRLALRARGVFTDADEGDAVPFYLQPTLGGAANLRGFREFRFRDQNAMLVGAEYQGEAWWALDPALFVDAGTVAPTRRQLSLRDLDVSYGVGFRLHSNSAFVARLDVAFSREGFIPFLRFDHVF